MTSPVIGVLGQGHVQKMRNQLSDKGHPVNYQLPLDDTLIELNPLLGKKIRMTFQEEIHCLACGKKTKKSFSQGYCYRCMTKLARCDSCIMSPEKCHYDQGTCREPEWGDTHCNIDHFVYLANSSGVKVGITRGNQIPVRWMDQGAAQALPIARVATRKISGLLEVIFKQHVADKTNWRALLKGAAEPVDLLETRNHLMALCAGDIQALQNEVGLQNLQLIDDAEVTEIVYPVSNYPEKIKSHNFDKEHVVEGVLEGIKGQYLMLDTGVINMRKFTSYLISFEALP